MARCIAWTSTAVPMQSIEPRREQVLMLNRPQGTAVGERATHLGLHVECQSFVPWRTDLDPMRSSFETHILPGSVEVVDRAHVEAVNVDLGGRRLDPQTEVAGP